MRCFPIVSPQAEDAPEISEDAFKGLKKIEARHAAEKKEVPNAEAQKAPSQGQEAYIVSFKEWDICIEYFFTWMNDESFLYTWSIHLWMHMGPCPDESYSSKIPWQPFVEERKDSFSDSWHQGELPEQLNTAIAKLLILYSALGLLNICWCFQYWISKVLRCRYTVLGLYQYMDCPLPALLSFFRHVDLLQNSIKKMDAQYDECNTAMAQGEVNGYDAKLPSFKKYII